MSLEAPKPEHNWYTKARSRLWVGSRKNLSAVPPLALIGGTFFYAGLSPFASGTVGSAVASLLYFLIPALQSNFALIVASLVVLWFGTVSADIIEKKLGESDPSIVVADEVLGQWMTYLTLWYAGDPAFIIIGFFMFRAFDIFKLWPASIFERKHGGLMVMLDDAAAAVYANIAAHLLTFLFHRFVM